MSYWDVHEPEQGTVDWGILDKQLQMIADVGARASLCIGMRQPRYPETHVPAWALSLDEEARCVAYMKYHRAVIERYRSQECIESWQLENEFWNRGFGQNNTFSRQRLVSEFNLLRQLDPTRPIIMSLANTYGYPLRAPRPDIYGTTIYLRQHKNQGYTTNRLSPIYFKIRSRMVRLLTGKPLVIHELQAEPWGPCANWDMSPEEQSKSMDVAQLQRCVSYAKQTGMRYIDLWGAEWWYWRYSAHEDSLLWSSRIRSVTTTNSKGLFQCLV
jgi:hypothetical protein